MRTRRNVSSSDPAPSQSGATMSGNTGHISVLLHEAITLLAVEPHHVVLDGTVGGAGHTKALANMLGAEGTIVGLDRDVHAIERARKALTKVKPTVRLGVGNFKDVAELLPKLGVAHLDRALFDLGWSSYQLEDGRGFSFKSDEPLLMTYTAHPTHTDLTASEIVNTWGEESIADIIFGWGEERFARRIAKAIVAKREQKPIQTARELAELIESAVPSWYRYKKTHPATKTFQALRIATNDELGAIREGLAGVRALAHPGARVGVITFHSIEDRVVKNIFVEWKEEGIGAPVTKKPVAPTDEEVRMNPRARSAKLRVFAFT